MPAPTHPKPGFIIPTPQAIEAMLNRLNQARNELDALTIDAPQSFRQSLYPLINCIELFEKAALAPATPEQPTK